MAFRPTCFYSILILFFLTYCRPAEADKVDFNRDIRPILSSNCLLCHGPDESSRKADLRLDLREEAIASAIDLEDPDSSELLERISSDDPDYVMPPPEHGDALTESQRQWLERWIREGAHFDKHWAYKTPVQVAPPLASDLPTFDGQVVNEIDRFVLQRLAEEQLTLSRPATKQSIIRRLALDLTGLPPTIEEVQRFVEDSAPDAYEKIVDDFLRRKSYGERWASMWLDLARYADSAGFAEDRKRTIWPYRDWVIRAFNDNKPFDEFSIEQLAGDLLPGSTEEDKIATAFHRNTLTNSEGGTDDEEFRSAAVVDRVNTTMAVWTGMTMACAQCHTHKYDPITQAEYFQVYDFLNQTADNDRPDEQPVLSIYSEDAKSRRAELQAQLAAQKRLVDIPPSDEEFAAWLESQDESLGTVGRFVRIDLPGQSKILSLAEVEVFVEDERGESKNVATDGTASQSSNDYGGIARYANDGNTSGDFSENTVTHTKIEANPWWELDLGKDVAITNISVWNRAGSGTESRLNGFSLSILDKKRRAIWNKVTPKASPTETKIEVDHLTAEIRELFASRHTLTTEQTRSLKSHYASLIKRERQAALSVMEQQLRDVKPTTTVPIMEKVAEENRRVTKIHIRGSYRDTGDVVTAGTPAVLHALPANEAPTRLSFARWLVSKKNPLTARVVVNRYWEQLFGIGLVATSEEFGSQGELPSHPHLLDWLAVDLMEHEWDTRHLLKKIVMSATYRQTSKAKANALNRDPNNRLLARGPRVRLSAEMIRDQALAVSGLLSRKMFGPPVQPPQPKVGLRPAFTGRTTDWTDSTGEDRYRRGIYTEWRRSSPYPSMATFDMNSREVCEIRRTNTNTPLQALVTLNDPVYVEAAQALARRVLLETRSTSDEESIRSAFELCLIRPPTLSETQRLTDLLHLSREHFQNDREAAKLLAVDPLHPPASDVDLVELASWVTIGNVILNLDEMLMKP